MDSVLEINDIYYDISHPAGYGSLNQLTEAMKNRMTRKEVKN